jgi:RND family efflux transporter MFP subunit
MLIVGVTVLAAIGALLLWAYPGLSGGEPETGEVFDTVRVERRDLSSSVIATGIIKPKVGAEVRVGSRVSGIVQRLHVNVGDRVQKGALLAELDPIEFEARVSQAEAALKNAEVTLELARQEVERKRALYREELLPQSELDQAETTVKRDEARLDEATANLAAAQIQLDYTKIQAPIGGVVASVSTQEGETVAASFAAPTFVTIIDLRRLEVWAYVDETDIGKVEPGQKAVFTVDTYPDTDFEGAVSAIQPGAEVRDNVVNYVTLIQIASGHGRTLRPEMTTTVNITMDTRKDTLTVPNGAVRRERGRRFVYVLEDDGPVKRWVKTGWRDEAYTEVTEGVEEAERVITGDFES